MIKAFGSKIDRQHNKEVVVLKYVKVDAILIKLHNQGIFLMLVNYMASIEQVGPCEYLCT